MNVKQSPAKARRHKPGNHRRPSWKQLHRNWRLWVVVGLMVVAMLAYVLSDDEAIQPGGGPPKEPTPAAAGP